MSKNILFPLFSGSPASKTLKLIGTCALLSTLKPFKKPKSVENLTVFITGAASGIGRGLAVKFALNGAKVVLADINLEKAQKVSQEISAMNSNKHKIQVIAVKCDVTDISSIRQAGQTTRSVFGPPDILINNAGIVFGKPLTSLSVENIELTFKVNTISHFYTIKEFLPDMLSRDSGHIVTIASFGGHVGSDKLVDYSSSKFACVGLDEALRTELKIMKSNVKTTCINPYFIDTGMFSGVATPVKVLSESFAVNEIFKSILLNEKVVFLPRYLGLVLKTAKILPFSYYEALVDYLKFNRSMDHFTGRPRL